MCVLETIGDALSTSEPQNLRQNLDIINILVAINRIHNIAETDALVFKKVYEAVMLRPLGEPIPNGNESRRNL